MVNDSGTTHAPIFIINNKMDINKDKLSISCKLQLFGIYLYIYILHKPAYIYMYIWVCTEIFFY